MGDRDKKQVLRCAQDDNLNRSPAEKQIPCGNDKQSERQTTVWEEVDEEVDGGVSGVCGVAGGCGAAVGADGLRGFSGEPDGGAGAGGWGGGVVVGGEEEAVGVKFPTHRVRQRRDEWGTLVRWVHERQLRRFCASRRMTSQKQMRGPSTPRSAQDDGISGAGRWFIGRGRGRWILGVGRQA